MQAFIVATLNYFFAYNIRMDKKQRGRPKIDNPATETIPRVRVKPEQLQSYRDAADNKDVSLSDWVRTTLDKAAKRELKNS